MNLNLVNHLCKILSVPTRHFLCIIENRWTPLFTQNHPVIERSTRIIIIIIIIIIVGIIIIIIWF